MTAAVGLPIARTYADLLRRNDRPTPAVTSRIRRPLLALLEEPTNDVQLPAGYTVHHRIPDIEDYLRLRRICGLTPRSVTAADAGLPHTMFAVTVRHADRTIGMGRIVGDGALFLHIVDIAVDPAHQGLGLGKAVMATLMAHIEANAPAEVHVSLLADGNADRLYAQFGFEPVAPRSQGMAVWLNKLPA